MNHIKLRNRISLVLAVALSLLGCGQAPSFTESEYGLGHKSGDASAGGDSGNRQGSGNDSGNGHENGSVRADGSLKYGSTLSTPPSAEVCATAKTFTQPVKFVRQDRECPFGEGDNSGIKSGTATARIEELQTLTLPEMSGLCDLGIKAAEQSIIYDDHLVLSVNGIVVLSNYSDLLAGLSDNSGLKQYDWNKIRDKSWTSSSEFNTFCVANGSCKIPESETWGVFGLDIATKEAHAVYARKQESKAMDFRLVTIGDNDQGIDCKHSEITLEVTLKYVSK